MDNREKLIEILRVPIYPHLDADPAEVVADYLLDNGVTIQKWIPASDPPKSVANKVIVLCKNGYRGYGHYENYKGKQTWYNLENDRPFTDWNYESDSYEVTHWMPLPEAPKED